LFIGEACYPAKPPIDHNIPYSSINEIGDRQLHIAISDKSGSDSARPFLERLPMVMIFPTWSSGEEKIALTYSFKSIAVYITDTPKRY